MNNNSSQQKSDERLFSRAAEAAVLASIIVDPGCFDKVSVTVGPDSFALPEHILIYQTLLDMREDDTPIDGLTIRDRLESGGGLEKIGGLEYLSKLIGSVPSSANAEHYARIVLEKSKRRRLFNGVREMKQVTDSDGPIGESIQQVQAIAQGLEGAIERSGSEAIIVHLSDVEAKPICYLWPNRIPCGMLTIVQGEPGRGKSFFTLDCASRVSKGSLWPDSNGEVDTAPKGGVIILTAEDDLQCTVRPRLDRLGADVSKIAAIEGVRVRDENDRLIERHFSLRRDVAALRQAIKRQGNTKLVIIDPLSAYLLGVDSHRDSDVRSVLAPLVQLAEDTGVSILAVLHLNKNVNSKALYRGLGSIAFTAAARTVWLISTDPDEPNSRRRLFTPVKHNVLIEPQGLAFKIQDGRLVFEDGPCHISSDEALGSQSTVSAPEKERAITWLRETLMPGKSYESNELTRLATEQNISPATLRRAKNELGVASYPLPTPTGRAWFIELKTQDVQDEA